MHSCITALIIVFLHFLVVEADYIFSIHLASFSNPGNRLANGSCCNGTTEEGICVHNCEVMLRFCVRAAEHPQNDTDTCSFLDIKGTASPRGINPAVEGPWEGSVQLHIGVTESGTDQLIDNIFIELNLTANGPLTLMDNFTGLLDQAIIDLQFQIVCAFDYFGMDCNTFCKGRNDTNAHYTCDENGDIECIQGYQNESSNCTQCAPAEGCSPTNGFCSGPGECLCHEGWRGEHCDECIPADGCSPTGGFCISPGDCICRDGYSGNTCDIEVVISSTSTQSNIIIIPSSVSATPVASSSLQMFALAVSSVPVVLPSSSITGSAILLDRSESSVVSLITTSILSTPVSSSSLQVSNTMEPASESPSSTQLALPATSIATNPTIPIVASLSPSVGSGLNARFVAVGVGVAIGGILLILAAIALAVVIIHQRKKKKGQFWLKHHEMNLSTEELIVMQRNSINSGKSTPDCHVIGQALCDNHPAAIYTKDGVPDLSDDFKLAVVDTTASLSMEEDKSQNLLGEKEEKEKPKEKVLIKITRPPED